MIGNLLSTITRVATLPIDLLEIGADIATGGDGSRKELKEIMPMPSDLRDKICETLEDID